MKKLYVTLLTFTIIYFTFTGAMWIPNSGANGDNNGPGVWSTDTTDGVQLSWDSFEQLFNTVVIAIQGNHYEATLYDFGNGAYAQMYYNTNNNRYYIRLYSANGGATPFYLQACGNESPLNGVNDYPVGRFWAYKPKDDPNTWKPFWDRLAEIYDSIAGTNGILPKLNTIINNLTNSASGYIYNIRTYTNNTANRLTYTVSGNAYTAAQSLYNIWAQLGSSGTLAGKADDILTALGPNGSIVGALGVMQNSLTVSLSPGTKINTILEQDSTWITPYVSYTDGTDYPVLHVNEVVANNLVSYINTYMMGLNAKYLDRDTDYNIVNASRKVTHAYINNNNEIRVRVAYPDGTYSNYYLCTPQHSLIQVANSYVNTSTFYTAITNLETAINNSSHDYSTVLNNIKNSIKNGDIWVNNNTSLLNSMPTVPISYEVGQQIVATLNDEYVGKTIKFLATNGDAYQYTYTTEFSHAYIDSYNKIRLVGLNSSGNSSTFTMVTPNRSVYVVQKNTIVDALDRIYTWLDNADLATNQTIINIINDDEDAAQNSVTIMSRIRALFRSVYDFNGGIVQTIADFANSTSYFNGLGVD